MATKVTMQQIADYLGVSKYVVSKALAGKPGVNAKTREKVYDAASKLGYFTHKEKKIHHIHLSEEKLTGTITNQIVLVLMPNVRFQTKESSYWGRIVDGISVGLEKLGFGMFVVTENNVDSLSKVLNPDGFVGVISVGVVSTTLLLEIHRLNLPLVMIDYEDPLIPCDTIFTNNFDSSLSLTNHLIGLGHKRMQFVGDIKYSRSFYDRFLGYRSAIELNDLWDDFNKQLFISNDRNLKNSFSEWLENCHPEHLPTAFVCANDNIAMYVIKHLQANEYHVPVDFSVTGFDNKEHSYNMSPTLTTVDVPKLDLGKRAVEMITRRIREKVAPHEKLMMSGTILLRESTAIVKLA